MNAKDYYSKMYRGLSYEGASREALRLIQRNGWYQSFERLAALREIMEAARQAETA